MKTSTMITWLAVMATATFTQAGDAGKLPLGHPDFYPSSERPIGWRGDRTGAWPGARCVTFWDAETGPSSSREGGTTPWQGENIAWKANTPGAGFSQPLVVGEKVFVTCEPNLLLCYNVHTGEEVWRAAIDHTTRMDTETAKAARAEIKYFDALVMRRGRWSSETEELSVLVEKAGVDMKAIWKQSAKSRALLKPEATGEMAKLLADAKIKALWERLYAEQEEYALAYSGDGSDHSWTNEIKERAGRANRLYDIWFDGAWDGFCPSWPTPCSDGERIYVATHNNAVAAVNLDGTIAWMVWDHLGDEKGERRCEIGSGMGTRYASSPVLYGKYLYVDNDSHHRVYDTQTGKKLWEYIAPYGARQEGVKAKGFNYNWGGQLPKECVNLDWTAILKEYSGRTGPKRPVHGSRPRNEATSPVVVEVPLPGGALIPVVYDGMSFLYRLEDGKVLSADMPFGQCTSAVGYKNIVMSKGEGGAFMVRLTAKDQDTIEYTWLYYTYPKGGWANMPAVRRPKGFNDFVGTDTGIAYGGWWYGSPESGYRSSLEDGHVESWAGVRMGGNPSPILVGTRIYSFGEPLLYEKGAFNLRKSVVGLAVAASTDVNSGVAYPIERSHIDRRLAEDSDYALRYAYTKAGQQGGNASPCAQANRIFHRTKGVLYCYGDPGEAFPAPKDCPPAARAPTPEFASAVAKISSLSDEKALAGYLDHAHPAVRAAAARRLTTPASSTVERLQRLAREDLSAAVRGAAILALGAKLDQPGGAILREQILAAGEAGPWQHCKPALQRVIHTLRVLGPAGEPALLSVLQGPAGKGREAALACAMWKEVALSETVREALLTLLADRVAAEMAAQALAMWPKDPQVTARFTELLDDPKRADLHAVAFSYLLPQQAPDRRTAFLEARVANGGKETRGLAVAALVGDGQVEKIRPLLAKATGPVPGEIAGALSQSCAGHPDPAVAKAALNMIVDHLVQADKGSQAAMVGAITQFFAEAEPALPKLKALNPGDDAKLKQAIENAIKVIEQKVKETKK